MQRIPVTPPQIKQIDDDFARPLWSVMIPTYNCSKYLPDTIKSVLEQDMGVELMQIEVVDDCSTDENVEELVQKIGKGRVSYYKQNVNVGSLRNFETCINRSRGHYIHLLHGDDKVKNGYYSSITSLFEKFPEAGAAFCAWSYMDGDSNFTHNSNKEANAEGILENWLYKLAEYPRIQYVAITVKRKTYETLGGFYLAKYGEDWEMWARVAKNYPIAYTPEALACYREHNNSITWQSFQNGENIKDMAKVIAVIISYLPEKEQKEKRKIAQNIYIYWILNEAYRACFIQNNKKAAYNQLKTLLSVFPAIYVFQKLIYLLLYIWTNRYREYFKKTQSGASMQRRDER